MITLADGTRRWHAGLTEGLGYHSFTTVAACLSRGVRVKVCPIPAGARMRQNPTNIALATVASTPQRQVTLSVLHPSVTRRNAG